MKRIILTGVAAFLAVCPLRSQSFNASGGYGSSSLFSLSTGDSLGGMAADTNGDLYYMLQSGPDTNIYRRTAADGYSTATSIFSYGTVVYGGFVKLHGGKVYFGESSTNVLRSIQTDGTNVTTIGTVAGLYDMAFYGSSAYISANPGGFDPENQVYRVNLGTGALTSIVDTDPDGAGAGLGDYSGPIAFSSTGQLVYGAGLFGGVTGGIYRFDAADVASGGLLLGDGVQIFNNGNNQYFSWLDDAHLFQADSPFGSAGKISIYDLSTLSSSMIGTAGSSSEFISGLTLGGSTLYVAVTDGFGGPSTIFAVVPEPGTTGLILCGLGVVLFWRRRICGCAGASRLSS